MIIYGSNSKHLITQPVQYKCDSCETANTVSVSIYQRYAHVFWIPAFPIGKIAAAQCTNCGKVTEKKAFNTALKMDYERVKAFTSTPVWTFVGLFIVVMFITFTTVDSKIVSKRTAEYLMAPQVADLYEITDDEGNFSILTIEAVAQDSVSILLSEYMSTKRAGLSKLKSKGREAFDTEPLSVAKSRLAEMYSEGKILKIERK